MSENYHIPLYWSAPYQKEILAKITAFREKEVQFNQSLFYPGGGGQLSDNGTLIIHEKEYQILEVFKSDDGIWHKIDRNISENIDENQNVLLKLNWKHRYANMKAHSAQHLISHLLKKRFDCDTEKANFEEYKIDIELTRTLSPREIVEVIQEANDLIEQGIAVESILIDQDTYQKEYKQKARGKISSEETVRLIQLGEDSIDLTCCGGIHVNNLSEIKGIILDSVKESKIKLYVDKEALTFANQQRLLMLELENITAKQDDKMLKMVENKIAENELLEEGSSTLLKILFKNLEYFSEKIKGKSIAFLSLPTINRQTIQYSARELVDNVFVAIAARNEILYLLSSDNEIDAIKIANSLMQKIGTKGGGNKNFAQLSAKGIEEPLEMVRDVITSHLK